VPIAVSVGIGHFNFVLKIVQSRDNILRRNQVNGVASCRETPIAFGRCGQLAVPSVA
jgi:hypothetical protein